MEEEGSENVPQIASTLRRAIIVTIISIGLPSFACVIFFDRFFLKGDEMNNPVTDRKKLQEVLSDRRFFFFFAFSQEHLIASLYCAKQFIYLSFTNDFKPSWYPWRTSGNKIPTVRSAPANEICRSTRNEGGRKRRRCHK